MRTEQYVDSNLVPVQIGVQPKSKGKSKHGKDARIKSSEKVKTTIRESVITAAGHTKSQSSTRLKDLADAEEKPVDCVLPTSSTAADATLADDLFRLGQNDDRHVCGRTQGSDQTAQRDTTVASTQFVTAPR